MKKYDEGYALPMVLVVILILCLVASYILSGALQTVTAQQDSIAQMKQEYAAQGEIEKIVSQMKSVRSNSDLADLCAGTFVTPTTVRVDLDNDIIIIQLQTALENQTVQISCQLELSEGTVEGDVDNWTISEYDSLKYTQYTILREGGAA